MERKRKSRIKQLIAICFVVFLAAFSLPFPVRAAESLPYMNHWDTADMNPDLYDERVMDEGEQVLLRWLRLEMRNGSAVHFNQIQDGLQVINNNIAALDGDAIVQTSRENKTVLDSIKEKVFSFNIIGDLETFYAGRTSLGADEDCSITATVSERVKGANKMWTWVGKTLESGGDLTSARTDSEGDPTISLGIDLNTLTNRMNSKGVANPAGTIKGFMLALAYAMVLVFFSVGLIEQTVKYEIVTTKGAVSFIGRIFVAKVIIDLSTEICLRTIGVTQWICRMIVGAGNRATDVITWNNTPYAESRLWIIGKIIDFINSITALGPLLIIAIIMIIICGAILIKLLMRNIQLFCLIIVAPPFFATLASETTRRYFRNYFTAFLQCALQVVFMCLVWYAGIFLLNENAITVDTTSKVFASNSNLYRAMIIFIVMGIMICKPPKFLTNALN